MIRIRKYEIPLKCAILLLIVSIVSPLTTYAEELIYVPEYKHTKVVPHKEVADKDKICFVLYTSHNDIMKMVVQFFPLGEKDSREVHLEIQKGNQWKRIATEMVREDKYGGRYGAKAWNLRFRVENWDMTRNYNYRVVALDGVATYEGVIRKDPVDKNEIVVAAFTGNSFKDKTSRNDIVQAVKAQEPDLLFFSGDQVYHHTHHLGDWLIFGQQFGELTRNCPTVSIPDDHDVGQGNLWGASGKVSKVSGGSDGGYSSAPSYVREVEFAQVGNLPDPYDPTPVQRGIGVYYTSLNIGGIDFAIVEDRKFKNGPLEIFPEFKKYKRADTPKGLTGDDVESETAVLLGRRQLAFLKDWGQRWEGVTMKTVLSQTIFCQGHSAGMDLDSNGWPRAGRDRAVRELQKSFAFHLAGDQHLGTVIQHGVDEFGDAGYSFSVPAIVNHFPRRWSPRFKRVRPIEGPLKYLGDYFDYFNNKITMHAHANPKAYAVSLKQGNDRARMATGHGVVRFNKKERTITMECWPRGVDPIAANAKQYPGWPITISQMDNYGKKATTYLPQLNIKGKEQPVVQVINEKTKEVVYTLRIKGNSFRPKVFASGTYTIHIGEGAKRKTLKGVKTEDIGGKKSMSVKL